MQEISGRTAFVTGGNRGIGRAICNALAEAGADIALNYSTADDQAQEVVDHLKKKWKVKAEAFKADISDEAAVHAMIKKVEKAFGRVTILVNNAGINQDKSFVRMTRAMWDEVLGVNLNRPIQRHQCPASEYDQRGLGPCDQYLIDGWADRKFRPDQLHGDQKGGLIAFTMTLAREVGPKGRHRQCSVARLYRDGHDRWHAGCGPHPG